MNQFVSCVTDEVMVESGGDLWPGEEAMATSLEEESHEEIEGSSTVRTQTSMIHHTTTVAATATAIATGVLILSEPSITDGDEDMGVGSEYVSDSYSSTADARPSNTYIYKAKMKMLDDARPTTSGTSGLFGVNRVTSVATAAATVTQLPEPPSRLERSVVRMTHSTKNTHTVAAATDESVSSSTSTSSSGSSSPTSTNTSCVTSTVQVGHPHPDRSSSLLTWNDLRMIQRQSISPPTHHSHMLTETDIVETEGNGNDRMIFFHQFHTRQCREKKRRSQIRRNQRRREYRQRIQLFIKEQLNLKRQQQQVDQALKKKKNKDGTREKDTNQLTSVASVTVADYASKSSISRPSEQRLESAAAAAAAIGSSSNHSISSPSTEPHPNSPEANDERPVTGEVERSEQLQLAYQFISPGLKYLSQPKNIPVDERYIHLGLGCELYHNAGQLLWLLEIGGMVLTASESHHFSNDTERLFYRGPHYRQRLRPFTTSTPTVLQYLGLHGHHDSPYSSQPEVPLAGQIGLILSQLIRVCSDHPVMEPYQCQNYHIMNDSYNHLIMINPLVMHLIQPTDVYIAIQHYLFQSYGILVDLRWLIGVIVIRMFILQSYANDGTGGCEESLLDLFQRLSQELPQRPDVTQFIQQLKEERDREVTTDTDLDISAPSMEQVADTAAAT